MAVLAKAATAEVEVEVIQVRDHAAAAEV
jgi:hypothetical protein